MGKAGIMVLLLFTPVITFNCTAQVTRDNPNEKIFMIVEDMPDYPGGEQELLKFLSGAPFSEEQRASEKKVYACWTIDTSGRVREVSVKRSSGDETMDRLALEYLSTMPRWNPGKHLGELAIVRNCWYFPAAPLPDETKKKKKK